MKTKTSMIMIVATLGAILMIPPMYADAATMPDKPDEFQQFSII